MPNILRTLPYHLAIYTLKKRINKLDGVRVWHRNSVKKGNFVFGVSDLDITIFTSREKYFYHASSIEKILKSQKFFFPFLGEVNFYLDSLILSISPSLNFYERMRDPELSEQLQDIKYQNLNVDKIVFLLRMIYADKEKLGRVSFIRQKKWKAHFQEMAFETPPKITTAYIVRILIETMQLPSDLEKKVSEAIYFLLTTELNDQNIYHIKLPELWKFLFPHKHLWFHSEKEEKFDIVKGTILEEVCLRQIDWEVWGLMSQLPFLPNIDENLIKHLANQGKASQLLCNKNDLLKRIDEITIMAEDFKEKIGNTR